MNPFEDDAAIAKLERRLGTLVAHFKALAPGMSDLPLYNDKVAVEAVDFMPFGDMGLGVLVTPWFINAVFLPLDPVPYDIDKIGRTVVAELPAGQRSFVMGGDEATGLFWSHSILSPLTQIVSHEAAVILARAELAALLTQPRAAAEEESDSSPEARSDWSSGREGAAATEAAQPVG
jgi:[NiFe] hydrogenase assembly HybE family chaperone